MHRRRRRGAGRPARRRGRLPRRPSRARAARRQGGGPFSTTPRATRALASGSCLTTRSHSFAGGGGAQVAQRALGHGARVLLPLLQQGHERHEGLFQEQRRGRRAGEGLRVRVEAAALGGHDRRRTAGALWLACGSSAVRTRAPASFPTKSPTASSASPPSQVFSPARFTAGAPKRDRHVLQARGSRNRTISRASATASFAICERSESSAGTVASASWCNSGTRRSGWCTVSLGASSRDSYCSCQFRSMGFAFEAFVSI